MIVNNFVRQEMKLRFGNVLLDAKDAGAIDDKTWQRAVKWADQATPEGYQRRLRSGLHTSKTSMAHHQK